MTQHMIDQPSNALTAPPRPVPTILSDPTLIPQAHGVYGWWFRDLPVVPMADTVSHVGYHLSYIGTAPSSPQSRSTLRARVVGHHLGNDMRRSTLRYSLAAILCDHLGLKGNRLPGHKPSMSRESEARLTEWMAAHGAVSVMACDRPWQIEAAFLTFDPPLNIQGANHPFIGELKAMRRQLFTS